MKKILIKLLFNLLLMLLASRLLSFVQIDTWQTALTVVVVLSLLNVFLKPVLTLLTIPITIFTLGFFLLVINAFMILLTDYLVTGFKVHGFWAAMVFGLILSIANMMLESILKKND